MSFGVILAMGQYVSRFWQPITNLANIYNSFVNNIAYLERIFETMDEPVVVDDQARRSPERCPPSTADVDFRRRDLWLRGRCQTVLENVNLHVRAGESIALVGPHRGGQIHRGQPAVPFLQPATAAASLLYGEADGQATTSPASRLNTLRNQLGIMLQDSFIFSGTHHGQHPLRPLGRHRRGGHAEAARLVRAHDFIARNAPAAIKPPVNERGSRLSARARSSWWLSPAPCLSDPRILILDEATSSIDTQDRSACFRKASRRCSRAAPRFIIAHRLSTIKSCDRILYIGNKGILESGSHDELMAQKGYYYELYTAQTQAA
ncbi:MAG: hypothetical protein ACLUE8_03775 [Lachnospiraceae bacterium]